MYRNPSMHLSSSRNHFTLIERQTKDMITHANIHPSIHWFAWICEPTNDKHLIHLIRSRVSRIQPTDIHLLCVPLKFQSDVQVEDLHLPSTLFISKFGPTLINWLIDKSQKSFTIIWIIFVFLFAYICTWRHLEYPFWPLDPTQIFH